MRETRRRFGSIGLRAVLALSAAAGCDSDEGPLGEIVKHEPGVGEHIRSALAGGAAQVRMGALDTVAISQATRAFYDRRRNRPAWVSGDGEKLLPKGRQLLELVGRSAEDGLDPEQYHYSALYRVSQELEGDSIEDDAAELSAGAALDVAMTEAFLHLAGDLARGTVDPQEAGLEWKLGRADAPDRALLAKVVRGALMGRLLGEEEPEQVLERLRPANPQYGQLQRALARYQAMAQRGGWKPVPKASLGLGKQDPAASALRARLIAEGDPEERPLAERGARTPDVFDEGLEEALKEFQRRHALEPDGRLGENTLVELNHPVEGRILELRMNLDRWRWLPRALGERYILVNVAGQHLEVVERDSVVLEMRVVVGQVAWQTPIFRDTMQHMVVNPYWNVPENIYREELGPAERASPGHLARNNYEVISTSSADFRVRQRPGPNNALGKVKFLFPNQWDIYLHDTPAGELFKESQRAFSHGCIRLEQPLDLAYLLLPRVTRVSRERFDELIASGKERWIKFNTGVPVYILYFTAWVDNGGSAHFYHDVYEQDLKLAPLVRDRVAGAAGERARPDSGRDPRAAGTPVARR